MNKPATQPEPHSTQDEPELANEESVPTDGKDPVGEKLMEQLGAERRAKEQSS